MCLSVSFCLSSVWRVFHPLKCWCTFSPIYFFFRLNESSMAHQRRNRNRNALETLKEKPLNLLHPYRSSFTHLTNFIPRHEREMNKQIISTDSTDQEVKFYMFKASPFIDPSIQYADGDKHFRSDFVHFQQTKFIDDYSDIREQRSKSIKRPVPRRPSSNHFFTRPAVNIPSLILLRLSTSRIERRATVLVNSRSFTHSIEAKYGVA